MMEPNAYYKLIHYLVHDRGCHWLKEGNLVRDGIEVQKGMFTKFEWSPAVGRENLEITAAILAKHDIEYWVAFGTLLGIYRDGDLIEYDHDVDLSLKMHELLKFIEAYEDFESQGFFAARISFCKGYPLISFVRHNSYVDFYPFSRAGLPPYNWHLYNFSIPNDMISNLQQIEWKGRKYPTVSNIEKYLEAHYGADWRTPKEDSSSESSNWIVS